MRRPPEVVLLQRYQIGDQPKLGFVVKDILYGGMGIVYILEARLPETPPGGEFLCVLKSYDAERIMGGEGIDRIRTESLIWLSLLPHPNIVKALSYEVEGGVPLLMLEYVEGGNLRDRLTRGTPPLPEFLRIASEFCEGMTFLAKSRGIVHRDIKPENILFKRDGRLKITDFGLAIAFEAASEAADSERAASRERPMAIEGTIPYMAPEQFDRPDQMDARADIYAFGIVMYEMLSGSRPFNEGSVERFRRAHQRSSPPPLENNVPRELRAIVEKCLAKAPGARFDSFPSLAKAINEFCRQSGNDVSIAQPVEFETLENQLDDGDWNNRGYSFSQLGDFDEAVRCYRRGIELAKKKNKSDDAFMTFGVGIKKPAHIAGHVNLLDNLGATLVRLGRIDEAKQSFLEALDLDPNDAVAYLRLGQLALGEEQVEEGLALLKRSTECEPGNFDLLLKYLRACHHSGDESAFEASFRQFLDGKKGDSPFLTAIGCLLDEEIGPAIALRCFDAVLEHDQDAVHAWFNKGVTLNRMGREVEALRCYEHAVRLDRSHGFARLFMGFILMKQGKREEARWHVETFARDAAPGPLLDVVRMALQGAAMGLPLESLLLPLASPLSLKHVM